MTDVRVSNHGGVSIITLDNPDRRNAISPSLALQLESALRLAEEDDDTRAVVITGEGSSFCSGADRDSLRLADEATLKAIYRAFLAVSELKLPTIAAVNGPAIGAGLNLALACDVRIAGESALFDSRFLSIPIHPGGGHTWMLSRATSPQVAFSMSIFGQTLTGLQSVERGLAWACVPDVELLDACVEFCKPLLTAPRILVREIKETLQNCAHMIDHQAAIDYELDRQLASVARPEYTEKIRGRK